MQTAKQVHLWEENSSIAKKIINQGRVGIWWQ